MVGGTEVGCVSGYIVTRNQKYNEPRFFLWSAIILADSSLGAGSNLVMEILGIISKREIVFLGFLLKEGTVFPPRLLSADVISCFTN